jgi:hypothetical protein
LKSTAARWVSTPSNWQFLGGRCGRRRSARRVRLGGIGAESQCCVGRGTGAERNELGRGSVLGIAEEKPASGVSRSGGRGRDREAERAGAERAREIELLTGVPARKHYSREFPKDWSPPLAVRSEPARNSRDVMPLSSSAVATRSEGNISEGSRNAPAGEPETLVELKEQLEVSSCGGGSRFPRSGSLGMEIGYEERGIRRWIQRWRDSPKPSRRSGCPFWR